MNTPYNKVRFTQEYRGEGITCTGQTAEVKEYRYKAFLVTPEFVYMIDPYWTAYEKSAKEAKQNIENRDVFLNIVDNLNKGIIIDFNCYPCATIISRMQAIKLGVRVN